MKWLNVMHPEQTPQERSAPKIPFLPTKKERYFKASMGLLIFLLLSGIIGSGIYQYQQNKRVRLVIEEQKRVLAQMQKTDTLALNENRQIETALSARIANMDKELQPLVGFYQELHHNGLVRASNDIEQMLTMASETLYLNNDIQAAIVLLEQVDSRVRRLNYPELINFRLALQKDIGMLSALPKLDIATESARLDTLLEIINTLPLHIDVKEALSRKDPPVVLDQSLPWWKAIGQGVWQELKSLVQIRRIDHPHAVLLSVEQDALLRENMRLRLISARIALMGRHALIYQADLKAVEQYVQAFFAQEASSTKHAIGLIKQLLAAPIQMHKPMLTSLEMLRDIHTTVTKVGEKG